MSKRSSNPEEFIRLLEQMIDYRYQYLKERELENHHYAYNILEKYYNPTVEKILEILEKKD